MREIFINEKSEGKKLFRFIKMILPGLKNSEIFKLIRTKVIKVNNKKSRPEYLLKKGDVVNIFLKDEHINLKGKKNKFVNIKINLDTIYEDENIIVINKSKGILTHPDGREYKNNLFEQIRAYLYKNGEYRPGIDFSPSPCHRLDRNTTGVIIFAKNHKALQEITTQFRERKAEKTYLTIVYGKITKEKLITSKIKNSEKQKNMVEVEKLRIFENIPEKDSFIKENPELSATLIRPLKIFNKATLLEVELWTGKKHQVRAHLKAIGHPLLGEKKYFTVESKKFSDKLKLRRNLLHSYKIRLNNYPLFKVDPPDDFKKIIRELLKK